MAGEITFNDFFIKIKTEFSRNGLDIPDDIELIELAHMECIAEEAFPDEYIRKMIAEQKDETNS